MDGALVELSGHVIQLSPGITLYWKSVHDVHASISVISLMLYPLDNSNPAPQTHSVITVAAFWYVLNPDGQSLHVSVSLTVVFHLVIPHPTHENSVES